VKFYIKILLHLQKSPIDNESTMQSAWFDLSFSKKEQYCTKIGSYRLILLPCEGEPCFRHKQQRSGIITVIIKISNHSQKNVSFALEHGRLEVISNNFSARVDCFGQAFALSMV
jgi:hypothetical protein